MKTNGHRLCVWNAEEHGYDRLEVVASVLIQNASRPAMRVEVLRPGVGLVHVEGVHRTREAARTAEPLQPPVAKFLRSQRRQLRGLRLRTGDHAAHSPGLPRLTLYPRQSGGAVLRHLSVRPRISQPAPRLRREAARPRLGRLGLHRLVRPLEGPLQSVQRKDPYPAGFASNALELAWQSFVAVRATEARRDSERKTQDRARAKRGPPPISSQLELRALRRRRLERQARRAAREARRRGPAPRAHHLNTGR